MDRGSHESTPVRTIVCRLTPSGRIDLQPGSLEDGPYFSDKIAQRIVEAFSLGRGNAR